jgi:hypothetical protein
MYNYLKRSEIRAGYGGTLLYPSYSGGRGRRQRQEDLEFETSQVKVSKVLSEKNKI